jgi:hypothetical protein
VEERCVSKVFQSSRSFSTPSVVDATPPQEKPMDLHCSGSRPRGASEGDIGDMDSQEQPMDLSCPKTKTQHPEPKVQPEPEPEPVPEPISESLVLAVPDQKESYAELLKEETVTKISPFMGNIVITDITTNSLTVTFKEYVSF